jgi:hypothetical protein
MMLLAGTRVALGVGIGLLAARRLDDRVRKGAGVALLIVGALTTVPIVLNAVASSQSRLGGERATQAQASTSPGREHPREGALHGQPPA